MAGGLNLNEWMKHSSDDGARGKWLRTWNKNGVGEAVVWLHTLAPIVPCFSHSFMLEDEYTDKETQQKKPVLRFTRFNSEDPEPVHRNQYFREDNGVMKILPDLDPFLLLREWLRFADHIALNEVVFQWTDFKKNQVIQWNRGQLAGTVKRGNAFSHSLDTKLEYVFVVVDNADRAAGAVLARFGKLLSQRVQELVAQQRKLYGDDGGDPMQHPYAFHLISAEAKSAMDTYKVFKEERLELTDDVWNIIGSDEFPDPVQTAAVGDGDYEKMRDAMEAAAKIELPFDRIFSEDPEQRRALCFPQAASRPAPRASRAAQQRAATAPAPATSAPAAAAAAPAVRAPAKPRPGSQGASPATAAPARVAAPAAAAVAAKPAAGRRRLQAPPPEAALPPPTEPDGIPCDACGLMMAPTDTTCEGCGAVYEAIADDPVAEPEPPPLAPPAKPRPRPAAATSLPAATTAAPAARARAAARPAPAAAAAPPVADENDGTCWACSAEIGDQATCPSCGVAQDDDIPF